MNKQRVLIKHHAQLAEPVAVQQYYRASALAADHLLQHVIGKPLQQVVIADAITVQELKDLVGDAISAIEGKRYFDAMIATRKALFRAVESEYDIRKWAEHDSIHLLPPPIFGGRKAPYHTRNRAWIQQNVGQPTDYVQLDFDRIRGEMLEIGIDPEEFFNVWRLTPAVYFQPDHGWAVTIEPGDETAATEDSARYCLDVVVSIIRNRESRTSIVRRRPYRRWRARILHDQMLLARATQDARTETTLRQGAEYDVLVRVTGMDGNGEYVHVVQLGPPTFLSGYIPREACDLEEY